MRTLYSSPEEHEANAPATWTVGKNPDGADSRHKWSILDKQGKAIGHAYPTKREATAAIESSAVATQWARESRWYAGEALPGVTSYADVLAEREAEVKREQRKVESLGIPVHRMLEWNEGAAALVAEMDQATKEQRALSSTEGSTAEEIEAADVRVERVTAAVATMTAMLELLTGGTLVNIDSLNRDEATKAHRELGEAWDLESAVDDRIHRIQYLGLDREKTALEVLREMQHEEREASEPHLWNAA